jgi:predicted nucleotidyltransferase
MDTAMEKLRNNGVFLDYNDIAVLCEKYHIHELAIFGSSIRDDFNAASDIDILVSFDNDSNINLFDLMDLEKDALKNPIRKNRILSTREIIYAA